MPSQNHIEIACAGSGKTTRVADRSRSAERRIAFVTYTNNNESQIRAKLSAIHGHVPSHCAVSTWFTFLLHECVRPYQRSKFPRRRVSGLHFTTRQSTRGVSATQDYYYLDRSNRVYADKISRLVLECNNLSGGAVFSRLAQVFTDLVIDEVQDLAGWDLSVLEALLECNTLRVTAVGDPRQFTYRTNPGAKNKGFQGVKILELLEKWERRGICRVTHAAESHRCPQSVLDLADSLWPELGATRSLAQVGSDHSGTFLVRTEDVAAYCEALAPQALRYSRKTSVGERSAINFGESKGMQFPHVLIFPNGPIEKYLQTGDTTHVGRSREKLYVGITRAQRSVAFVYDGPCPLNLTVWRR